MDLYSVCSELEFEILNGSIIKSIQKPGNWKSFDNNVKWIHFIGNAFEGFWILTKFNGNSSGMSDYCLFI